MKLASITTTDITSVRVTDLELRDSRWMIQCTLWMDWVCLAPSQWCTNNEAGPSLQSLLGHRRSSRTQDRTGWGSVVSIIALKMSSPVMVPCSGTNWRNFSWTCQLAVNPWMEIASWTASFMSVLSSSTREKASKFEKHVISMLFMLSDISVLQ